MKNLQLKMDFQKIRKHFNKDIAIRIYSLIIAIILWIVVSATLYPTYPKTINNVVFNTDMINKPNSYGYSIISLESQNVSVRIIGQRTSIGNLKNSDIKATVDISDINAAGKYTLPVEISSDQAVFTVDQIIPSKVTVNIDKIITKTFIIETETPNIKAAEGYQKSDAVCNPQNVSIRGPQQQVEEITRCVVRNDDTMELNESTEIVAGNELILYNNTTVLSKKDLTPDESNFSLNIPIYIKKILPLTPTFTNIPQDFPINKLKYTIDPPEIEVSAPNAILENQADVHLCYVNIHDIDLDYKVSTAIILPDEYHNLSGQNTANITFDTSGLSKKTFMIANSNISVINAPAGYKITPVTSGFNVPFIGEEAILKDLTIQDIVVQLDLSGVVINGDDYSSAPISFIVPNKGLVWSYGTYTVTFRAQEID